MISNPQVLGINGKVFSAYTLNIFKTSLRVIRNLYVWGYAY